MSSLPDGWETTNIKQLTTLAREYLVTVLSYRERNKQQREIAKKKTFSTSEKKMVDKGGKV
eukprot:6725908-Ditylum_brightwellii.AAC.1